MPWNLKAVLQGPRHTLLLAISQHFVLFAVAQANFRYDEDLELLLVLTPPSRGWVYQQMLACLVCVVLELEARASCRAG